MKNRFIEIKKIVPFEVLPLGVAIVFVLGLASYRLYKASKSPEVVFSKRNKEKWRQPFENEYNPLNSSSNDVNKTND